MKKIVNSLFVLLLFFTIPVLADVDTKDGFSITTSTTLDGFTGADTADGFTITGGGGGTPPTYSSDSYTTNYDPWSNSTTVPFTPTAGSNSCVVIFAVAGTTESPSTATYNGAAVDEEIATTSQTWNATAKMFVHCTSIGTSQIDVVVNFSGSCANSVWVTQFDGVNTSDPINVSNTGIDSGGDPQQVSVSVTPTVVNTTLVSGVVNASNSITTSICNSTGQTMFLDASGGDLTINGGYFQHSTATSKAQCYQGSSAWTGQLEIVAALNPA